MDADFLVFYRIDLRDPTTRISAESFFSRVFRLFNYRGALRDRLQAEQEDIEEHGPPPMADRPRPTANKDSTERTNWVSPDEMRTLFPDLF